MKLSTWLLIALFALFGRLTAQSHFDYSLELIPITIPNLPGLHSYAYGQSEGKWLVLGGRLDGLHARQPFNAFPATQNNTDLYVIDVQTQQFWTASINTLAQGLKEQLQSTNMEFFQDNDTLYIIGGYARSESQNDHITFPYLTSVDVPGVINAVINNNGIGDFFKQAEDPIFAVTGGQLGKLGDYFYLVGGHRFDGRYNPMGQPTYIQEYSNEIRKFTIDNSGGQLSFGNYSALSDPVHLHRRDYNLMPQIFPNGDLGYTISSGVFQLNVDLPYLYPVDIRESGIEPITTFNQYLSNYHGASASLFDANHNEMYSIFFGGMSQYYYENGVLIQDDSVPFVKTISLLVRDSEGNLTEFAFPMEMPILTGASAEFIINKNLAQYERDIIRLDEISESNFTIGYIYGGINSPLLNPFNSNQTSLTSASSAIYEVKLSRNPLSLDKIDGANPYALKLYPNPTQGEVTIQLNRMPTDRSIYYLSDVNGKIIGQGVLHTNELQSTISLPAGLEDQALMITLVIDNIYFLTHKIIKVH